MKRSRFSEEHIIAVLKEAEATSVKGVCAKYNISDATYYNWKYKFGGMDVDEARRLRALEDENGRLKRLVADRCARSNERHDGLASRRQLARELSEPIRSGVGTSFTIRPRGEALCVS
jgi:putative transposase